VIDNEPLTITDSSLFGGAVHFSQPSSGDRAAVDGLLLAWFCPPARKLAVDLGAGAGVVSLALHAHGRAPRLLAIEQQPALSALLAQNLAANGWSDRSQIVTGSVDAVARAFRGAADLVVATPPYDSTDAATPRSPSSAAPSLRGRDPLEPFVRAARSLLGRQGRACWVFPARELERLLGALAKKDLHPRRMLFVHARPGAPASRVLVECSVGRPGAMLVDAPWILSEHPERSDPDTESTLLRDATRSRPAALVTERTESAI
jgi:tRNA1(Val) A37 N6-methylase TrmN6